MFVLNCSLPGCNAYYHCAQTHRPHLQGDLTLKMEAVHLNYFVTFNVTT